MKKIILLSSIFFASIIHAQVGIGTTNPRADLELVGNFWQTGAYMPNGDAGNSGEILLSVGVNNPPVWGLQVLNVSAISAMGKFFVNPFNINRNTYLQLTVTDTDARIGSVVSATFIGPLPNGPNWGYSVTILPEPRNGSIVFHIINSTTYNITNLSFSYFAVY